VRASYTPWARGVLGSARLNRIRCHLTDGLELEVGSVSSPFRFVVRLWRGGELVAESRDVGRAVLWERIGELLEAAGEPLVPDEVTA
jgi:hypothetical protein